MMAMMMMMVVMMMMMMVMPLKVRYLSQSSHCCVELSDPIPLVGICLNPSHLQS